MTFLAKNLKGLPEKIETLHVKSLDPVLKKATKQQFKGSICSRIMTIYDINSL